MFPQTAARWHAALKDFPSLLFIVERHKTLGITVTVLFVLLAGWRVWRKGQLRSIERRTYLSIATVSALTILWTTHIGSTIVYEYGGGIPTAVLEGALQERGA